MRRHHGLLDGKLVRFAEADVRVVRDIIITTQGLQTTGTFTVL